MPFIKVDNSDQIFLFCCGAPPNPHIHVKFPPVLSTKVPPRHPDALPLQHLSEINTMYFRFYINTSHGQMKINTCLFVLFNLFFICIIFLMQGI